MTDSALRAPALGRTDPGLARWRNAVLIVFAMSGFIFANWAARVPNVRDILGATTREMGLLILGIAIGAIVGLIASSHVIAHLGPTTSIRWFMTTAAIGLALSGLIVGLVPNFWLLVVALFVIGAGNSILDVSMNLSGADAERRIGKTLMPLFHAFFSFGTMLGAGVGALTEQLGIPVEVHLTAVGAVVLVIGLHAVRSLPPSEKPRAPEPGEAAGWRTRLAAWTDTRVLLIGLIVLGMAFTEGTANDWLSLSMVDGYGLTNPAGAAVFALFVTAMTIGRVCGGALLDRFGRVPVLVGSAMLAFAGLLLVIIGPTAPIAIAGTVLWGLGAALGFPVGMSAAADDPEKATANVAAVATIGYVAFLVGPPLIGLLGDEVGLRKTFLVVLVLVAVALLCSPAARKPKAG